MFVDLLKRLAIALNKARLPYMVFGGQAVLLYGEPRLTQDVDITLGVDPAQPAAVLRLIEDLQLRVLVDDVEAFLQQTFVLPVLDRKTCIRVDLVFSLSGYEREAIDRSNIVRLDGIEVRFVSLEDLIVMKIVSGRPRDLEDVAGVIRRNRGFDRGYVGGWLAQFDSELGGDFSAVFDEIATKIEAEGRN